jgi:hypothetical protein
VTPQVIPLVIIVAYLALLLCLGLFASRLLRGTSQDYMLASHTIGPFLLLMSLFGTTMTGFALVGSTGESFKQGIGVYGLLASSSGIVNSIFSRAAGKQQHRPAVISDSGRVSHHLSAHRRTGGGADGQRCHPRRISRIVCR